MTLDDSFSAPATAPSPVLEVVAVAVIVAVPAPVSPTGMAPLAAAAIMGGDRLPVECARGGVEVGRGIACERRDAQRRGTVSNTCNTRFGHCFLALIPKSGTLQVLYCRTMRRHVSGARVNGAREKTTVSSGLHG
jgi:hypothetical protein